MPPATSPRRTASDTDSAFQAALDLRAVTSRLRRRIMAVTDRDDLSPGQASALMRIARGEALTAGALAEAEKVTPQSIAVTLAALARGGYITRTPDPRDGRRQLLDVTDAGRARVDGALDAGRAWLETAMAENYTESERRAIIDALALVERILE